MFQKSDLGAGPASRVLHYTLEKGAVGPGGHHTAVNCTAVSSMTVEARPCPDVTGESSPVIGWPASFPVATESWPMRRLSLATDDTEMTGKDDLSMSPEIVVDMASELQDANVLPMLRDRELDTDVQPPPTMVAMKVDVAVEEIFWLLQEISRGSHRLQRRLGWDQVSSSACPKPRDPVGKPALLHPPILSRPLFQVNLLTWYPAGHGQWLRTPPRATWPIVRLQPLCPSSLTHGWETTKKSAQGL